MVEGLRFEVFGRLSALRRRLIASVSQVFLESYDPNVPYYTEAREESPGEPRNLRDGWTMDTRVIEKNEGLFC